MARPVAHNNPLGTPIALRNRLMTGIRLLLTRGALVLPLHPVFSGLILPLAFTVTSALISLHITSNAGLTVAIAVAAFFTTLWAQSYVCHTLYRRGLRSFLMAIQHTHIITQKFVATVLHMFVAHPQFPALAGSTLQGNPPGPANLHELATKLQSDGVVLSKKMYEILLTEAGNFWPSEILATWDTRTFGLDPDRFPGYVNILKKAYRNIAPENKTRVFIFENHGDYENKVNTPEWRKLLDLHYVQFGFTQVHYCYRGQFEAARDAHGNADQLIDDFVYFCTSCLVAAHKWIIGCDVDASRGGAEPRACTYVRAEETMVKATRDFYLAIKREAEDNLQVIALPLPT